jgi:hypothetical protein
LDFKKDAEEEFLSQITPDEREKYELSKHIPLDSLKEFAEQFRSSLPEMVPTGDVNFGNEVEGVFNRPNIREGTDFIPPGPVVNEERRTDRIREEIEDSRGREQPLNERHRKLERIVWDSINPEVRTFLKEEYGGRCQICNFTFQKRDGESYFECVQLVSRTITGWIDRPGNYLCLCANCCSKFQHGEVIAKDLIQSIRESSLTGNELQFDFKLCGKDESLSYSERHLIDFKALINTDHNEDGNDTDSDGGNS